MEIDAQYASVVKALRTDSRVTETRMFGSDGLKVSGKVFGMLFKGEFVLKLPADRVDKLVRSKDGRHFDPGHGRLMKEWVSVALSVRGQWMALAKEARDFVASGTKKTSRPHRKTR